MHVDNIPANFTVIVPKEISFVGNKKLSEYEVIDLYNRTVLRKGYSGVHIVLEMRNMYNYYIISTYIPTFLLIIISYMTYWFDVDDFTNRIMVALTSLLVLAALFSQISSTLPKTAYLKLIDVWYLCCIILDFVMVLCLVITNSIKNKDDFVKDIGQDTNEIITRYNANKVFKISLLVLILGFVLSYCLIILIADKDPLGLTIKK